MKIVKILTLCLSLTTTALFAAENQNANSGQFRRGVPQNSTTQTQVFDESKGKPVSPKPTTKPTEKVTVTKLDTPPSEMKKPAQPLEKARTSEVREGGSKARPPR